MPGCLQDRYFVKKKEFNMLIIMTQKGKNNKVWEVFISYLLSMNLDLCGGHAGII